jgi:replication initiation protein RepC
MYMQNNVTSTFRGRKGSFARTTGNSDEVLAKNSINRWQIHKQLCIAKSVFDINDRCLAVLSALLSFHPDNEISTNSSLVVFPSNRQLALRAHGMPESSLRRHIASLVDAGLIVRRDSPNGKRYAYKSETGEVEEAFGFSVAPLLERAGEIARAAAHIQAEAKLFKRTRERITLLLENAEICQCHNLHAELHNRFRTIVDAIPRRASIEQLNAIKTSLEALTTDIVNHMKILIESDNMVTNNAQNERHHIESDSESLLEQRKYKLLFH